MRRLQAILAILTLGALPLVLLAQDGAPPTCDGMCCLRHPTYTGSPAKTGSEGMSCHHGAAGHLFQCGVHSTQHRTNDAVLAPLPPTMLSALVTLPAPPMERDARTPTPDELAPGFVVIPFEPPRS